MTIEEVLSSLAKGEALTDEARTFLSTFDIKAFSDSAAAKARRKADEENNALRTKISEYEKREKERLAAEDEARKKQLTDEQRHAEELKQLTDKVLALEEVNKKSAQEAATLRRARSIENIRASAGLKFIEGVDPEITSTAFSKVFDGLENLDDEEEVSSRVAKFREANKGLILDTTGFGDGKRVNPSGTPAKNPWSKDSFNLTEQIKLEESNPAEAARLKASAQ